MANTSFACTFDVTVEAMNRTWNLTCTASPQGWDCIPTLLWCENNGATPWVPGDVWDVVEDELRIGGPARIAYDVAMSKASVPFLAEAAE